MQIQKSTSADLPAIMRIYASARQFMVEQGNPNQWINGYPNESVILADIERGNHFLCIDGEQRVGCFTFARGDDPTYAKIVDGSWLDNGPYAVIHRIAVSEQGKGVGSACLDWCFEQFPNIRIDTHRDNAAMRKLIHKKGFQYCGIIFTELGHERLAFQKINKEQE